MAQKHFLSTIAGAQSWLATVYVDQNTKWMTSELLCLSLIRRSTTMMKLQRKGQLFEVRHQLAENFAWLSAIATRFNIDLQGDLWHFFPNVCPYCEISICGCESPRGERKDLTRHRLILKNMPVTFEAYQSMLKRIYLMNTPDASVDHFVQEAAEVGAEVATIRLRSRPEQPYPVDDLRLEVADALANLFAVASCLDFSLADVVWERFEHGCPECKGLVCTCGSRFTIETIGTIVETVT